MDFELDESQQAVADLADQILGDRSTPEHVLRVEADTGFDDSTWDELVKAGLVGIAAPEHAGGGGLGMLAAGEVAKAVGRHAAAVPAVGVLAAIAGLVDAGRLDEVTAAAAGTIIPVPALDLGPDPATVSRPSLRASPTGDGWSLTGELLAVGFGSVADHFVVPASVEGDDVVLLLVPADASGLTRTEARTTSRLPAANLAFEAVPVPASDRLGGHDAVEALVDRFRALGCRAMSGVCQGALSLAASYTSEREQFGTRIGTFQAVAHRLADAYIDGKAIELTGLAALWRVDGGLDHTRELASACFWAGEGGQRIVHATQHVHGGIGVDVDYPQHRYFRRAKDLELALGGGTRSLVDLGADLAREPTH